jgi:hypothetical protein
MIVRAVLARKTSKQPPLRLGQTLADLAPVGACVSVLHDYAGGILERHDAADALAFVHELEAVIDL